MSNPLSVVIITKNEEKFIKDAILSAKFADEVLVLDSGSIDKTCYIAKELGARIENQDWLGFGRQKNKAIELGASFEKKDIKSIDEINADTIVSAAGCWTKDLLKDIPVVPQKHTVFRVKCPKYISEMPLTGDLLSGVYWRPEGGEYLAGSPNSKFDAPNLEPEWNDFEELVWPALANRVPAFEKLKLTGGWAGYYDCNKLDNNAIVGKHPKYENVYLATGFTGRGLMQAPGIGRGLTELITTGKYQTIDLSSFSVERVLSAEKRTEPYVL